jgi:hypothetical protein
MKSPSYDKHLKQLKLPTLVYIHMHSDMILTYKHKKEDSTIFIGSHNTSHHLTRGH